MQPQGRPRSGSSNALPWPLRLLASPGALGLGLWIAAALALSEVTGRVTDWFDMTDELRYERLAVSIARSGSPLPRIHGIAVKDIDQLYPLLIAPLFRHGDVVHDLHDAHVLGAWVMSSACIPAYLLARRVAQKPWVPWLIGLGSVAIPWLMYASFLLTEVVAYPVFLWTMLALERAVAAPSLRADLAAVFAIVVAFFARTEFLALAVVLPLAVVLVELRGDAELSWSRRALGGLRRALLRHPLLAAVYGCAAASALAYTAQGGHLLALSAYGQFVPDGIFPPGFAGSFVGYVAQLAFALGVLPFVVGFGWLLANTVSPAESVDTHAFAAVASLSFLLSTAEIAKYSLGVGDVLYERFLFYFVPVILLGFVCALGERNWPRWSLALPLALVCAGFGFNPQGAYTWRGALVNPDTPVSLYYHPLLELSGSMAAMQALLVGVSVAAAGAFLAAALRVTERRRLGAALAVAAVVLLSLETGYVFVRLFRTDGWSGRPLTAPAPSSLEWVDGALGEHANVTAIAYPVSTDYWVSLKYWRDLEFWNKSVDRAAYPATAPYDYTGIWFPQLSLSFNPATGRANISPTRYVVQSVSDTRFQIAGNVLLANTANLIDADRPWRLSFLTFGAYDDGWLKPHTAATVRVYAVPGQRGRRTLYLSIQAWAPGNVARRPFQVRSNSADVHEVASNSGTVILNSFPLCVPAAGYAAATITAAGASAIPEDLSTIPGSSGARQGSIYLADLSVSSTVGPPCRSAQTAKA